MSHDPQGTPQSLKDAIANAVCIGPFYELEDRLYHHVRDFIAQRFSAAILEVKNEDCSERLKALFERIVRK